APGGDPHRRQGRRARRTRPAGRARGAGPTSVGAGRRSRTAARFPCPGTQSRSQHALLEIERRGAHQHRPRAQERGGTIPPAGPEPGVTAMTEGGRGGCTDAITRRGVMLVLSSPSGAGKTTLSRRLLGSDPDITLSISVTTRLPRADEVDGRDYHFIDAKRFDAMRRGGELLEWARVFDNDYGTPRGPVESTIETGRDVL